MRGALAIVAVGSMLAAASARADGLYVGDELGFSRFGGSAARAAFGANAMDLRVVLGLRIGPFALETWVGGDLPATAPVPVENGLPGYGVDAKYVVPLAHFGGRADGVFGAYGKAGLRAVWLGDPTSAGGADGSGRGFEAGVGILISHTLWAKAGPWKGRGVRLGCWIERSADWLHVVPGATSHPLVDGSAGSSVSAPFDTRVDHWSIGFGFGGDV